MTAAEYQEVAVSIPHLPGIYKYFGEDEELLYVGKAKDLRKRTASYFNKTFVGYKTHELVKRIKRIEFTIVDSEQDAFLLENSLIKQFKPKYNIVLKDDKTYPFIVIKKEPFPRIFLTRRKIQDGSEYLGPFTSAGKVRELLSFIKQYIPLRTCKLNLTDANIKQGKFKVCLEYHLGNCKAPCEALQSQADYEEGLQLARNILKGNLSSVAIHLKKEMIAKAEQLEFEKAAQLKRKLDDLENYQAKSVIVSKHLGNVDVFSIVREKEIAFVNYLMVYNGTIVQTHTVQLDIQVEEEDEDVFAYAINDLRTSFNSLSQEIILPFAVNYLEKDVVITVPKAGDKKKLLDLSLKNVNYFIEELKRKKALQIATKTESQKHNVLVQMQKIMQLPHLPLHIECFDNSNFQGSYPVSAMVCFKNGAPSKNDYRRFNVKTVKGINDFATMEEVVFRRYKRLLNEQKPLPQLIIIDGGKGQLGAAMKSISKLGLIGEVTVVGLAKNEEEIFYPGDSESLKISWDNDVLKLIRYIRDEVHRFGITFHRNQRSKGTFKNELEQINGIGKSTATDLLKSFKSVNNVKLKKQSELAEIIGEHRAKIVFDYFHQ